MKESIIHILIIWSKASKYKDFILTDLSKEFEILKTFTAHWDKKNFLSNYKVFYSHSQYQLSANNYQALLQGKIEHCGDDDFTIIILRDNSPKYEIRKTSSGERKVNTRIFDKKTEYRQLTGGGHKIHSSDDAWETNKDLTLLFGLNTDDFIKHYSLDGKEELLSRDCLGVNGYDSIQQLFYVLNNSIKYVVLRNHECLPNEYTVEGHGDIDLLVENKNYMAYLTGATPVYNESYRVYHTIRIGNKHIPFDFRYIGDNYYDQPWEEAILDTRVLQKKLFYTPNSTHQYFSLLYHAYIQKWEVKQDYIPKLTHYATKINEVFNPKLEATIKQLDSFLEKNRFEYIKPNDKTVVYNTKIIQISQYAFRYGQLIKRLKVNDINGNQYHSRVYEKTDSFTKIGTNWLIHNEASFLLKLKDTEGFPKVLSEINDSSNNETILEISRVEGLNFIQFFSNVNHQKRTYIKSFILGCIDLLEKLHKQNISHRDFLPTNLIISDKNKKSEVSLIDFGWATTIEAINKNRPKNLAERFVSIENVTDTFSLGTFLLDYWYDLPYIRLISKLLRNISYQDYLTEEVFKKKLNRISIIAKIAFTPYDEWRILCRRHLRIGRTKLTIKKIFNN